MYKNINQLNLLVENDLITKCSKFAVITHILPSAQTSSCVTILIMCPSTALYYGTARTYTSKWSYALKAFWDEYILVLLCTWGLWDICVPKHVGRIDPHRFERVRAMKERLWQGLNLHLRGRSLMRRAWQRPISAVPFLYAICNPADLREIPRNLRSSLSLATLCQLCSCVYSVQIVHSIEKTTHISFL